MLMKLTLFRKVLVRIRVETASRFSKFLKSNQTIISGAFWITFFALSSKLFGFVKHVLLGMFFGTSKGYDAVVIAIEPANFIAGIIAGAFAAVAIPLYLEEKSKNGNDSAINYARGILGFTSVFLSVFGLTLFIFPDFWIRIFAPGFSEETVKLAREYLKLFSILPILMGWANLFGTFLRAERKFFQYSLALFLTDPVIIIGLLIFSPFMKEGGYVVAVEMGVASVGFASYVFGIKIWGKFPFAKLSSEKTKRILYFASPLFLTTAFGTINNLVDKGFASSLPVGSVSALSYSYSIIVAIYSLVSGGLLTSSLTSVSESAIASDDVTLKTKTKRMIEFFINTLTPLAAFTTIAANWIVSVIYERGAFNTHSVHMTAAAVVGFSTMMVTAAIDGALGNIYIAKKRTLRLTLLSVLLIFLNAYMDWLLMGAFKQGGIAASSSIVSFMWMIVLWIDLKYKFKISGLFSLKTVFVIGLSAVYVYMFLFPLSGIPSLPKIILEILTAGLMILFFTRKEIKTIWGEIIKNS